MAKETQKAKIERLENELAQANKVIQEQNDYINKMHASANDSFDNSNDKKQLEDKIKRLEMKLKTAERAKQHAEKLAKAKDEHLKELKEQIKQLEANTNVHKIKNERRAGRKQKFINAEIQAIKMYRLQGKSYRAIADMFGCSVGLVHKIINEQKD